MTEPSGRPGNGPQPGEQPPSGRLARPPSERYRPRPAAPPGSARSTGLVAALIPALGAAIVMGIALVVVGGVLAERRGLLAIAGLGGAAVGLLAAGPATSTDGLAAPLVTRRRASRTAIGLSLAAVLAAGVGTWGYSLVEGGVLGPLEYLGTVLGPWLVGEALVAAIAAAWGAGAGPVRWRS